MSKTKIYFRQTKRCVSFANSKQLVTAVSAKSCDSLTIDSLEVTRKNSNSSGNNDEKDCESVCLSKILIKKN